MDLTYNVLSWLIKFKVLYSQVKIEAERQYDHLENNINVKIRENGLISNTWIGITELFFCT